jgi:hypothetical protein
LHQSKRSRKTKDDDNDSADEEIPMSDGEKKYRVVLAKYALLLQKGTHAQALRSFQSPRFLRQLATRR